MWSVSALISIANSSRRRSQRMRVRGGKDHLENRLAFDHRRSIFSPISQRVLVCIISMAFNVWHSLRATTGTRKTGSWNVYAQSRAHPLRDPQKRSKPCKILKPSAEIGEADSEQSYQEIRNLHVLLCMHEQFCVFTEAVSSKHLEAVKEYLVFCFLWFFRPEIVHFCFWKGISRYNLSVIVAIPFDSWISIFH